MLQIDMVNAVRGEIGAELDGRRWTLCLTLGALAALEESLSVSSLSELGEKFSAGTMRSIDLLKIITAGLNGAGHALSEEEVSRMQVDGGVSGYIEIAAALLEATFVPLDAK